MTCTFPWGKLDRDHTGQSHHLAHHCADVAASFEAIIATKGWSDRLEHAAGTRLNAVQRERLAVMVFLHDMGKLNTRFQMQATGGPSGGHRAEGRHILDHADQAALRPIFDALKIRDMLGWVSEEGLRDLLLASLSHHGSAVGQQSGHGLIKSAWAASADHDPARAAQLIGALLPQWFPHAFTPPQDPLPANPQFVHLFAGLVTLADFIGSKREVFPFLSELDRDYMISARARATQAVDRLGLDLSSHKDQYPADIRFADFTHYDTPNPAQAAVGALSTDAPLVILEAETGSGKTEAALWRFFRLWQAGQVGGLYFALPTRVAAKQLFERLADALTKLFGTNSPEPILAVPGYMRAGAASGRMLPGWDVLWDDSETEKSAQRWAAEHSLRFLAAPIAVGTVDQAMLGALTVRHAHMRGSCLSRSLLVVDEVHASDAYMCAVQEKLLTAHLGVGGYAMLMSATLAASARTRWLSSGMPQKPQTLEEAIAVPYPAIWTRGHAPVHPPAVGSGKSVQMQLELTQASEATARHALEAAQAGAVVLVIRNTVGLAQETLSALEHLTPSPDVLFRLNGETTLHHGRFAPEDREALDLAVQEAMARTRGTGGLIVCGTQTLEISLDIDADLLITDLCPVDVLLQRIGRLHRHVRPGRPEAFAAPRCLVLSPEEGLSACLSGGRGGARMIGGLGGYETRDGVTGIYTDLTALELTLRQIRDRPIWTIPKDNRMLVEAALHPEAQAALMESMPEDWQLYQSKIIGRDLANRQHGTLNTLDRSIPFHRLGPFGKDDEKIRTRLGADGMALTLDPAPMGPFGHTISRLVLPAHWSRGIDADTVPDVTHRDDGTLDIVVGPLSLSYDRLGLRKIAE